MTEVAVPEDLYLIRMRSAREIVDLAAVVSRPENPGARGELSSSSSIKRFALRHL